MSRICSSWMFAGLFFQNPNMTSIMPRPVAVLQCNKVMKQRGLGNLVNAAQHTMRGCWNPRQSLASSQGRNPRDRALPPAAPPGVRHSPALLPCHLKQRHRWALDTPHWAKLCCLDCAICVGFISLYLYMPPSSTWIRSNFLTFCALSTKATINNILHPTLYSLRTQKPHPVSFTAAYHTLLMALAISKCWLNITLLCEYSYLHF